MQHKNVILFAVSLLCTGLTILQAQTLKDIDGNVYKTVIIGTQVLMAKNLKTTKYKDGTVIPLVTDDKAWKTLTTPAYCWYNNYKTTFKNKYGALYNWYTVGTNKLCPRGWHVPTDAEWRILTTYLGGENVAGGKMKEKGTAHWESPNVGATNESSFTAFSSAVRNMAGEFDYSGSKVEMFRSNGYWWSSTELHFYNAYYRRSYHTISDIYSSLSDKRFGFSVRFLRD